MARWRWNTGGDGEIAREGQKRRGPLHPPVVSGAGHPYPQRGGFPGTAYSAAASPYQFGNHSVGQKHNQQQYAYPPSQPPSMTGQSLSSASFPPPLPQPGQLPHPPYYPSSQYSYYNPPHQPPPPPPPPPSSPPIHSSSFPPPPPPPASPPPPPPPPTHAELPRKPSAPATSTAPASVPAHNSLRHQKPPPTHPAKTLLSVPGRAETEEERIARKKSKYEKQKQEERRQLMLKQSQANVLQKTQLLAANIGGARATGRPHGAMVGSRMGDRRISPFLTGDRVESRLKKPTTLICKMKFRNELPDPTAQPKLLVMNTNKDRVFVGTVSEFCAKHAECLGSPSKGSLLILRRIL